MKTFFVCVLVAVISTATVAGNDVKAVYGGMMPSEGLTATITEAEGRREACAEITVNNSPAIVRTGITVDDSSKTVALRCSIIQNGDIYKRSFRSTVVTWQLPEDLPKDYAIVVRPVHTRVTSDELRRLIESE